MPRIVKSSFYVFTFFAATLLGANFPALSNTNEAPGLQNKWELVSHDDGIAVYKRSIPQSNFLEFRGVGVVDIAIPKMIALMADVQNLPSWVFGCIKGELVEKNFEDDDTTKKPDEYYQVVYGINALPWPLHNRDYVLKAQVFFVSGTDQEPFHVIISSRTTTHLQKPAVSSMVRMPNLAATFVFTSVGNNQKTLVDFSVTADPGGYVPAWITNFAARSIPHNTFVEMRKFPERTDYSKKLEQMVIYHYNKNVPAEQRINQG